MPLLAIFAPSFAVFARNAEANRIEVLELLSVLVNDNDLAFTAR
jgi:hypothetical protein